MSAFLLHCNDIPLQVLLQRIKVEGTGDPNESERQESMQRPVAKLLDYYKLGLQNKQVLKDSIVFSTGNDKVMIGPVIQRLEENHWYDLRGNRSKVRTGRPNGIDCYPKCLKCDKNDTIIVIFGQNGVIILHKTLAIASDPVVVVRQDGTIGALEEGSRSIVFGKGIHMVLQAVGVTVIIPGFGDIEKNSLIYTCIRPEVYGLSSPTVLQPLLFVYTGKDSQFYLVQIRQRLIVVNAKTMDVEMSDNFWHLEFNNVFNLFNSISNSELTSDESNSQNQYSLPKSVVSPYLTLMGLGSSVKQLTISDTNEQSGTGYEFVPKVGRIVVFANIGGMPTSVVVEEGMDSSLSIKFKDKAQAFIVTNDAIKITIGSNDYIQTLLTEKVVFDNKDKQNTKNHLIFIFKNGLIVMTTSDPNVEQK